VAGQAEEDGQDDGVDQRAADRRGQRAPRRRALARLAAATSGQVRLDEHGTGSKEHRGLQADDGDEDRQSGGAEDRATPPEDYWRLGLNGEDGDRFDR